MRKVLFILFIFLSVSASAQHVSQGQQIEQINNLASLYVEGRFDEIISEAEQIVGNMNNENKAKVYRIVAHAYIMNDQKEEAEKAVRGLLRYDSNYTIQTDDDVFFRRMIEKYRISTGYDQYGRDDKKVWCKKYQGSPFDICARFIRL